jgi:Transglutaminase-like superfamily
MSSLTTKSFKTFFRLSIAEQGWLIGAAFYLLFASIALKRFPLRRTQQLLMRLGQGVRFSASPLTLTRALWATEMATPYLPRGSNCFVRALALQTLLSHRGFVTQLYVGFAPKAETMEGHAWLEYDNKVLVGEIEDLSRFRPHSTVYSSQTS